MGGGGYGFLVFPKDVISGYSKQDVWARGEGAVTGIFGPNRTYKVGYWLFKFNVPLSLPSRTPSELHKLSKIKNFRSALRAEMFTSQELRRATQPVENWNFSLGASRRNGTQTNKGPLVGYNNIKKIFSV